MFKQRPVPKNRDIVLERASGRFNEKSFIELLNAIHTAYFSGKLLIKAREGFGTIVFREGKIASASTPTSRERLGELLVKKGVSGRDDSKTVNRIQERNLERSLESILVEEDYARQEVLLHSMKEISEEVLFSMTFWNGVYRLEEEAPPDVPDEFLIDSEQFLKKMEDSLEDIVDSGVDGLFITETRDNASHLDAASGSDPKAEIDKTLKDVAKSLTTFKPREVVIVVEDEILMRTVMADGLGHFGFAVEEYDNARDALTRIQELETDRISPVVILDIVMTGLYDDKDIYGGMDLLNNISQNFPTIPVIVATGVGAPEIRLKAQFLGASYFVNKPIQGGIRHDRLGSDIGRFVEEITYCLETIFRRQQAYLEKEQLASVREELLSQILKKGNVSFRSIEDVLRAGILIVDDEREICGLCEDFLRSEGFTDITIATDGEEAIRSFTARRHDIVITDIVMPKKNGIGILKYVKTLSPSSQVIIITGHSDKNTSIAAVKLGAFDYIEKPIDFQMLCENVKKAVEMKLVLDEKI